MIAVIDLCFPLLAYGERVIHFCSCSNKFWVINKESVVHPFYEVINISWYLAQFMPSFVNSVFYFRLFACLDPYLFLWIICSRICVLNLFVHGQTSELVFWTHMRMTNARKKATCICVAFYTRLLAYLLLSVVYSTLDVRSEVVTFKNNIYGRKQQSCHGWNAHSCKLLNYF